MGAELGKPSGPRPEVLQALETASDGDYRLKFKEVDPVTRAELFAMQRKIGARGEARYGLRASC